MKNFPDIVSNPIYFFKRDGSGDNPFVEITENIIIRDGRAFLKEVPEIYNRVTIKENGIIYTEVNKKESILNPTDYFVSYRDGVVYFHVDATNKSLSMSYTGTGLLLYPASRIYVNSNTGDAITTLQDLANISAEALNGYNTRLEGMLVEMDASILASSNQTSATKTQGDTAEQQGNYAKQQGDLINTYTATFEQVKSETINATNNANTATSNADLATINAETATVNANLAISYANTQGDYANTQGAYANEQGTYAKSQGDYASNEILQMQTIRQQATDELVVMETSVTNADASTLYANTQGDYAKQQGDLANQATLLANDKASLAQSKADLADSKATYAQAQGDYAKQQGALAESVVLNGAVSSVNGKLGVVTLTNDDVDAYSKEKIDLDLVNSKKALLELEMVMSMKGVL